MKGNVLDYALSPSPFSDGCLLFAVRPGRLVIRPCDDGDDDGDGGWMCRVVGRESGVRY